MKVNKKISIISLIALAFVGAVVIFYASNLLFSDLSNLFYGFNGFDFISSFPMFFFSCDFVLAILFVIRITLRPNSFKHFANKYLMSLIILSGLGLISSFLTAAVVYDDFLAPYPFPAYTVIFLLGHLLLGVAAFLCKMLFVSKLPDDEPVKRNAKYIIQMMLASFIVYFALNRFGALLWMPFYVHLRTLYMTFPFYLSLLLPVALLVYCALHIFGLDRKNPNMGIIFNSIVLVLCVALCISVIVIGTRDTRLISAISPAVPLERLATMPINAIFMYSFILVFGAYELVLAIKFKKIAKENS